MSEELYKKYRPTKLSEVVGQEDAIKTLISMKGKLPHTLLFTGPSGTGKTTIVRILCKLLKCSENDFREMNASDCRGIDEIRSLRAEIGYLGLGGACRVFLIDECHGLTSDAQEAFLHMLEDTPEHVYFFLATTNPAKLKKAIITRSTEIRCLPISQDDLTKLVNRVIEAEGKAIGDDVVKKIVGASDGSARKSLVLLHAVIDLKTKEDQLDAIEKGDPTATGFNVAQLLMKEGTKWSEMAAVLKTIDEDPEAVRRIILGYAQTTLLSSGKSRANDIIEVFQYDLYNVGKPGLVSRCYNLINAGR